jgi:hypothetical protein
MYRTLFACFLALATIAEAAPLWAQSLADVSRAEEERRKTIKNPSKVYTNKDLTSVPPPPAPATDAAAPAEGEAAAKEGAADTAKPADDKPAEPVKDQAYWGGRAKELQTQLERDQAFAEALQSRINALTTDFENRSDPAQRALVEQDRNRALAELERLRQAIQNDQKAIADFDEEARRAGVPPGWLR